MLGHVPWTPDNDDLLIPTIKCTACGKTWIDREDVPEGEGAVTTTAEGHYVCSNCGARAVWEVGVQKIERRQG
jgi:DNA-directed RNA polymerase subunit RPC12/RpoP